MDDNFCQSAHLVGTCGSGMKALAELLLDSHWSVSGSDLLPPNPSLVKLIERGLIFHQGHYAHNLPSGAQQLVYSSAVPDVNPERIEARRRQVPEFSYSQMIGNLMRRSTGVCIAGTHGKSTTTAMTASILNAAGRLASAVIGAELCQNDRSGWVGDGDLFVAESCEFQHSFLNFDPKYSILLNIEPDHFDCFPDEESLQMAFRCFADKTAEDGLLLTNADDPMTSWISQNSSSRAHRCSFGINSECDWTVSNCRPTSTGSSFALRKHGKLVIDLELQLRGNHNICNALAAAAMCAEIGVAPATIRDSLREFRGVRRRFELIGEVNGTTLIHDYAHHPTAVAATLGTLREMVGDRRILCVFQPHQISRTTALMERFSKSFFVVDEVFLAPVFAARESATDEPLQVSRELADRINSAGVLARSFASLDQIASTLDDATRPGDVIVTLGAGDIDRIHHELTRRV